MRFILAARGGALAEARSWTRAAYRSATNAAVVSLFDGCGRAFDV